MSHAGPRLIFAAAENAYVLTRPTLARRDAPIPKRRSRLVKILNVPPGSTPPVFHSPAASSASILISLFSVHILSGQRKKARFPDQGFFCRKRNAPYIPAIAMVTSSIVSSRRLTTASSVGDDKMKCRPRNSGACDGGVSQGGKRSASASVATMPYRISMLSCPGSDVGGGGGAGGVGCGSTESA